MLVAYFRGHWQNVRAGLIETVGKFHDDELDFRPYAAAWSVRELMLHIAQEEHGEMGYGIRQSLSAFPDPYAPAAYANVATIQALLAAVHASSEEYLQGLGDDDLARTIETPWGARYALVEMIGHFIEHEVHHRAELSLLLGMLGREGLNA